MHYEDSNSYKVTCVDEHLKLAVQCNYSYNKTN